MYCQVCGSDNDDGREYCASCHHRLLVLSGPSAEADQSLIDDPEASVSLDEHLLERISVLEEAVKRTAESVERLLHAFSRQEEDGLTLQTGLASLCEILERKQLLGREEWDQLWQSKMDYQLAALEKRERFLGAHERISAHYRGSRRKEFLGYLDEAGQALSGLDLDRATEALESAYRLGRDNYELAYFLGETHFNLGEGDRALPYFQRVLEQKPEHFESLVLSGVIHHDRGEDRRAVGLLKNAIAIYPDSFLPYFSLGAIYAARGNLSRAVICLERALEIESVAQAHYLLGSCYYEQRQLTRAIRQLKDAVSSDPRFEEAHYLLGQACLDRGWRLKALESFRHAQRLNPKKLRYQDLVLHLSGQDLPGVPEVSEAGAPWLAQGEEKLRRGKAEEAMASFRKALRSQEDHPVLLLYMAVAQLQMGRQSQVEESVRRILDLGPGEMLEAIALAILVEVLRSQSRLGEGTRLCEELLETAETNFAKTIAYYELAWNFAEVEGTLDKGLEAARRSLELAPDELKAFPLAALGWVYFKQGELDQAVELLTQSSRIGASATTLTHLGMAMLAAGDESEAREVLSQAREMGGFTGALEEALVGCLRDRTRLQTRRIGRRGERRASEPVEQIPARQGARERG